LSKTTRRILKPAPASAPVVENVGLLPLLPVKNTVLFPHMVLPFTVGRAISIEAVKAAANTEEKTLVVVAQRDDTVEKPKLEQLYTVGTKAVIKRMEQGSDQVELLLHGLERVKLEALEQTEPYLIVRTATFPMPQDDGPEVEALYRAVLEQAQRALQIVQPQATAQVAAMFEKDRDPLGLAYFVASMISLDLPKQQTLLETATRLDALQQVHGYLSHELQVLEVRQKIAQKAANEMSEEQRKFMLRQQLRAIQEELGEKSAEESDADTLKQRLDEADLPDEVRAETDRELKRLARLPAAAPDYQLARAYLELILELPWKKATTDAIDLRKSRRILDEDHFGLQDVKDRILEFLAVMKLNRKSHAPILCFVGPPGVGKTSLGQSIARAIGRTFERLSLGGMHDEAELRGHRRTYIGAMPGRIIQAVRRAKVRNPLLMLDEIDKLGRDFRGDPSSALLEILDPAQNGTFRDNYLDLPFDLSKVFFIATANSLDTIPRPLLDRMELLRLSGYAPDEKRAIAKRYLVPRRVKEAGLTSSQLRLPDETLERIIDRYTREAGVRELERQIGRLARKSARRVAEGKSKRVKVKPDDLPKLLGPERYLPEQARVAQPPGIVAGLAWTETGGEVLYIEALPLPESKELKLTGSLGDVMRESAVAALSWVQAHAKAAGIDAERLKMPGLHIHVPAGAVPKDGPSAGVAMATAIASALSGRTVTRGVAMTGEIALSGLVLPIGGLKEKVLAAHRAGLQRVILPKGNEQDLREIPANVRKAMKFTLATTIEDVLRVALPKQAAAKASTGAKLPVKKPADRAAARARS